MGIQAADYRMKKCVQAMQWNGPGDSLALAEFCGFWVGFKGKDSAEPFVTTHSGTAAVVAGWWVVRWPSGEFQTFSPGGFAVMFAPADGELSDTDLEAVGGKGGRLLGPGPLELAVAGMWR